MISFMYNIEKFICGVAIREIHLLVVLLWQSLLLSQWMSKEMKLLIPVALWINCGRLAPLLPAYVNFGKSDQANIGFSICTSSLIHLDSVMGFQLMLCKECR